MNSQEDIARLAISPEADKFDLDLDDLLKLEAQLLSLHERRLEKVILYSKNPRGFAGTFLWPKDIREKSDFEILEIIKTGQRVFDLIDDGHMRVECEINAGLGPLGIEFLAASKNARFLSDPRIDFNFKDKKDFLFFGGIYRLVKTVGAFNVLSFFFYKNIASLLSDNFSLFKYLEKSKTIQSIIFHFFLKKLFSKKEKLSFISLQNIDLVRDSQGKTREFELEKLRLAAVEILKS